MSRNDAMQQLVQELRSALPDLHGALVASRDGMALAHSLDQPVDSERVAAIASTALRVNERLTTNLELGDLQQTSVFGSDGHIYLYWAGSNAILALLTPHRAAAGPVHAEGRAAAARLAELVA